MPITGRKGTGNSGLFPGVNVAGSCDDPSVATDNRGSLLPQGGTAQNGVGLAARKAYQNPAEFTTGPNCHVGIGDPDAVNDYDGDFDDSPYGEG